MTQSELGGNWLPIRQLLSMRRLSLIVGVVLLSLAAYCLVAYLGDIFSNYLVGCHQQNVTRELLNWKQEYSSINSKRDAIRTAGMLEYVQRYYVPGEGYRSTPEIEAALQLQRQDTIAQLVESLRRYTGKDYGANSAQWLSYVETQVR